MAQLFDIKKVVVGPKNLEATVELAANAPLMTSEDLEGTTRVWQVMPELRDHVCLGDESGVFGDVMGNTELAHLLEHVTVELLARTGLPDPARAAHAYPCELSGGQQQRCMIAMALAAAPDLLVADEPTTALDVTTQKQVLALIDALAAETGLQTVTGGNPT